MGCSICCLAFDCFSTFLEWCLRTWAGNDNTMHYLDALFIFGKGSSGECRSLLSPFIDFTTDLGGVSLAEEKVEGPSIVLVFLGI